MLGHMHGEYCMEPAEADLFQCDTRCSMTVQCDGEH